MAEDQKYNGWTNYETWAVKLWIDNEEPSYRYWNNIAQDTWDESQAGEAYKSETRKEAATKKLSDRLKDEHENAKPEVPGVFADLLGAALSSVDWYEIAEALLEEYKDEDEDTPAESA